VDKGDYWGWERGLVRKTRGRKRSHHGKGERRHMRPAGQFQKVGRNNGASIAGGKRKREPRKEKPPGGGEIVSPSPVVRTIPMGSAIKKKLGPKYCGGKTKGCEFFNRVGLRKSPPAGGEGGRNPTRPVSPVLCKGRGKTPSW